MSLSWVVMQGKYTEIYPGSGKKRPYVQREGGVLYFLAPRCLRRDYKLAREGAEPKSQRKKKSTIVIA
jgi:ribosomal protein L24E